MKLLYGPADMEGHMGLDGRHYVLGSLIGYFPFYMSSY